MDHLNRPAGRTCWKDQLDEQAEGTNCTDQTKFGGGTKKRGIWIKWGLNCYFIHYLVKNWQILYYFWKPSLTFKSKFSIWGDQWLDGGQWYTTSLHTRYRLVGNSTPHFGVLCGDSCRSRAASLKESEQGKIALAEHVVSRAEPFKECNHNMA